MPLIDCLVSWNEYDTSALTATMKPADKAGSECGAHEMFRSGLLQQRTIISCKTLHAVI